MVGALTTVTDAFGCVSMHGIREELLRAQLEAAGLPAFVLYIPFPCPNEVYEQKMSGALEDARALGVTHMVFGDLFLADCGHIANGTLRVAALHRFFLYGVGRPPRLHAK